MPGEILTDLIDRALQAESLGRFDEARGLLRKAASAGETYETLDARLRLAKLLVRGAPVYHSEAEVLLSDARRTAEEQGAAQQAAAATHLLALLERYRSRPDRALDLLEQSPAAQDAEPSPERAQWLHYRGLLEADRGRLNDAERFYFEAHRVYREAHDDLGLAEVCDSIANLLLRRGRSRDAQAFARMSLKQKRKVGDRFGEAITLGTIGRSSLLRAQYDDAAEAFSQDLAIAEELGDARGVGIMLNSLAEVALLRKDPATALNYYERAINVDAGPVHLAHVYYGLTWTHLMTGRLDNAVSACGRLESVLGQVMPGHGLHHALVGARGALAGKGGDLEAGERLLSQAIEGFCAADSALDTIPLLYELRDLYHSSGSRAKAVGVMTRALDLLSECGSERGVEDIENWLRTVDSPKLTRLALEQYFPAHLVEGILGGRMSRPPSTKQEVTVLFSDIRDYTSMTEGLGAEQIVEILNDWFTEATRAIRRHGGLVDKFIGDAVMALFGVPEPRENAAADAVRAALAMREALAAMNMRSQALGRREIRIGIGIDSGEAVVGFIGSHLRQSYTAIGNPVNTASRLESATKEHRCDILLSQAVERVQQREQVAATRCVGGLNLKGRGEEVIAFQVL